MPWYPGLDGRYRSAFFDGRGWTAALTDRQLLVDGGWFGLDEITEVSYRCTRRDVGSESTTSIIERRFAVTDATGRTGRLALTSMDGNDNPAHADLWQGLVDISRNVIEPRLSQRILAGLQAGQVYMLRDGRSYLRLLAAGFTTKRPLRAGFHDWSQLYHFEVNPFPDDLESSSSTGGRAAVWVRRDAAAAPELGVQLDTGVSNVVLLATLLPLCTAAFGGFRG